MADTMLKNWEKSGRNDFLKKCKLYVASCSGSLVQGKDGELTDIMKDVYDLMSLAVKGSMKKDAIISVLNELSIIHPDMNSLK
ncbi:THO complex subunit 2-like, partial [Diaphorina citri]|uniref:THO complex subunit 2-like n=1 Tax=Diaphorina citri TaxID=121845 RepID=A0A1S4E8M4_DIACI